MSVGHPRPKPPAAVLEATAPDASQGLSSAPKSLAVGVGVSSGRAPPPPADGVAPVAAVGEAFGSGALTCVPAGAAHASSGREGDAPVLGCLKYP